MPVGWCRRRLAQAALTVGLVFFSAAVAEHASAVEVHVAEREGAEQASDPEPGWATDGRFGLFTANIATANAATSRDPEVNSSATSTRFLATFDGTLWWRIGPIDEVEQHLQMRYGRSRTAEADWIETADVLEYDAVGRHRYKPRRAAYTAVVVSTAFTGPEPWNDPFDPLRGAVSAGHSWLLENLQPLSDRLELRLGARAQKRWGKEVPDYARSIEIGPEGYLRYQRRQTNELSWWVQSELFTEFNDPGHLEILTTANLTVTLSKPLTIDLRLRAYFERHPADLPDDQPINGYDEIGIRQETLIGVTMRW